MKGKHILITGGSAGIGAAVAAGLVDQGAHVHLVARGEARLKESASHLGAACTTYVGDLGDFEFVGSLAARIAENSNGCLDGLVANAALYDVGAISEADVSQLRSHFDINVLSVCLLVNGCLPLLERGRGKSIVMVSSTLGAKPVPGVGVYAASKAALNSVTKSYALELAGKGIRVNAVLPGVVDTPIHDPKREGDPSRAEKMAQLAGLHPLGRVGSAGDVARAVMFLLNEENSWVTGSLFHVDGGIGLV